MAAPPPAAPPPLALSVAAPGRAPYVPPRKVLRVDSKGQATYVLVESERERERERDRKEKKKETDRKERKSFWFLRVDRDSLFVSLSDLLSFSLSFSSLSTFRLTGTRSRCSWAFPTVTSA